MAMNRSDKREAMAGLLVAAVVITGIWSSLTFTDFGHELVWQFFKEQPQPAVVIRPVTEMDIAGRVVRVSIQER